MIVFACDLWEMALDVDFVIPFGNKQDWKGIREKAEEVNSTKPYTTNDEITLEF